MKLYSDLVARRTAQVAADVGMLLWVLVWVWVGRRVHDATLALAGPGRSLESAGTGFRDRMTGAAGSVDDLPLLDDRLAAPFRSAAGSGTDIANAGRGMVEAVDRLSLLLGLSVAVVPILVVGLLWWLRRSRFVRRASAAQRFIDAAPDLDLFALRALASQPMPRLASISADPAGAWRRGEPEVVRALATLELAECGLRPPPL